MAAGPTSFAIENVRPMPSTVDNWRFDEAVESLGRLFVDIKHYGKTREQNVIAPEIMQQLDADKLKQFARAREWFDELTSVVGVALSTAEPMFWSADVTELVMSATSSFSSDTALDGDYFDIGSAWCWLESPIEVNGSGHEIDLAGYPIERNHRIVSISWCLFQNEIGDRGIHIAGWSQTHANPDGTRFVLSLRPVFSRMIFFGSPMSDPDQSSKVDACLIQSSELERFLKFPAVASAFLRSTLPAISDRKTSRPAQKRLTKLDAWTSIPEMRVVMLRRRESHSSGVNIGNSVESFEWKHQWLVRPHTRNQWYPSKHKHLPVFIAAHIKGPEDKPLKQPRTPVFAVTR